MKWIVRPKPMLYASSAARLRSEIAPGCTSASVSGLLGRVIDVGQALLPVREDARAIDQLVACFVRPSMVHHGYPCAAALRFVSRCGLRAAKPRQHGSGSPPRIRTALILAPVKLSPADPVRAWSSAEFDQLDTEEHNSADAAFVIVRDRTLSLTSVIGVILVDLGPRTRTVCRLCVRTGSDHAYLPAVAA